MRLCNSIDFSWKRTTCSKFTHQRSFGCANANFMKFVRSSCISFSNPWSLCKEVLCKTLNIYPPRWAWRLPAWHSFVQMPFVYCKQRQFKHAHVQQTRVAVNCESIHRATWFIKIPSWYILALHKQTCHAPWRKQNWMSSCLLRSMRSYLLVCAYACLETLSNALACKREILECAHGYICHMACFVRAASTNIFSCQTWCLIWTVQCLFATNLKFMLMPQHGLPNATRYLLFWCLEEWDGMMYNTHATSHWASL